MLYYTFLPIIVASIYVFIQPLKKAFSKVTQVGQLISIVSKTEENPFKVYLFTCSMISKLMYIRLLQMLNSTIRKVDRKTFEVSYSLNGKSYKMLIAPFRGPTPIMQVINDKDEDITSLVLPYMGPNYDWHGFEVDPSFFNTESLTFEMSNGEEKVLFSKKVSRLMQPVTEDSKRVDDPSLT